MIFLYKMRTHGFNILKSYPIEASTYITEKQFDLFPPREVEFSTKLCRMMWTCTRCEQHKHGYINPNVVYLTNKPSYPVKCAKL